MDRGMNPIERLGIGLAILSVGIALFMGLPPPWWSDMPPGLVHAGVALGVILIIIGSALVLQSAAAARRRHKMWPILGMAFFGIGFVACSAWYFWPAVPSNLIFTGVIGAALFIGVALTGAIWQSRTYAATVETPSTTSIPPDPQTGSKVTARLRLHYTTNPITSEILQTDNVAIHYTLAFLLDGTSATEPTKALVKWSNLIIVFDRPISSTGLRTRFDSGASLIYEVTKMSSRLAIIRFEGSLAEKAIDIETY